MVFIYCLYLLLNFRNWPCLYLETILSMPNILVLKQNFFIKLLEEPVNKKENKEWMKKLFLHDLFIPNIKK